MSYEQAAAIVVGGRERGARRHRSVALGVAAQFEPTIRQVDVIGVREKLDQAEPVEPGALVRRGRIWRLGLRFEDFAVGRLDLETSKNQGRAVFDVTAYPLFQQALAAVPATERHGPLVTDEGGRPVKRRYYLALYREVADAAGVPRAVWNMHARHGGTTEAQQAGVGLQDIAEMRSTATLTRNASTTSCRRSKRRDGLLNSEWPIERGAGQTVKPVFHDKYYNGFTTDELSAGAPEDIRTPNPRVRSLRQVIVFIEVGEKYAP